LYGPTHLRTIGHYTFIAARIRIPDVKEKNTIAPQNSLDFLAHQYQVTDVHPDGRFITEVAEPAAASLAVLALGSPLAPPLPARLQSSIERRVGPDLASQVTGFGLAPRMIAVGIATGHVDQWQPGHRRIADGRPLDRLNGVMTQAIEGRGTDHRMDAVILQGDVAAVPIDQ